MNDDNRNANRHQLALGYDPMWNKLPMQVGVIAAVNRLASL